MQDPLNIAIETTGVETTLPLLQEGDRPLQCVESAIVPNKKGTGYNWALKFATIQPEVATDGREVSPNFPLYQQVALQPSDEAKDPQGFKRGIAEALDGLFGTDKSTRPVLNAETVSAAVGKVVVATTYNDEYPKGSQQFSTKIRRLKAQK